MQQVSPKFCERKSKRGILGGNIGLNCKCTCYDGSPTNLAYLPFYRITNGCEFTNCMGAPVITKMGVYIGEQQGLDTNIACTTSLCIVVSCPASIKDCHA